MNDLTNTTSDRQLLADVSAWAHANGWESDNPGYTNAFTIYDSTLRVEVQDGYLLIARKERGRHPWTDPREYRFFSVRQAVDLLVALDILPVQFSSAYVAGVIDGNAR